jgi:hypothetical protein
MNSTGIIQVRCTVPLVLQYTCMGMIKPGRLSDLWLPIAYRALKCTCEGTCVRQQLFLQLISVDVAPGMVVKGVIVYLVPWRLR